MAKRRRGYRPASSIRRSQGSHHSHVRFEQLVERALAGIPMPFARALDEVAIVIADEPTDQDLAWSDAEPDEGLYGLYEGVPRTEWEAGFVPVPNRITIFRLPLEEDFPDPADLEREVRETVLHELAHHLGIDDSRLHELGHE